MSAPNKLWPLRDDYQKAVTDPKRNLKDPRLHAMRVEMKKMGAFEVPFSRNGNFGAVYKFANSRNAYALKVFADSQPEREMRYSLIHRHLASHPAARSLVSFSYEPDGIRIRGSWYPTLVMDWAEGDTLRMYLNTILERGGQVNNGQLCLAWAQAMHELTERRTAHGDLQHGNILVMPDGSMKLVDYDGMFVPAMQQAGMTAIEFGMAAYQHPKRYRGYFDKRLDDFGALIILLTLASVNRTRWQRCHKDDSYLLIKEADLLKPDQSALLTELVNSGDAPVKKLAVMVKRAAQGDIETIPPFAQIIADHTIKQLFNPTWRPTDTPSQGKFNTNDVVSNSFTSHSGNLTARQQEVLGFLVSGYPDEQIAQILSITIATVRDHIATILQKTGTTNRKDLVAWAMRQGKKVSTEPPLVYPNPPVQQLVRCSACQQALKPGDPFCRHCGKSVSTMTQPVQVMAGKCSHCYADLIAGDHFCRKCGKAPGNLSSSQPQSGNLLLSTQSQSGNLQSVQAESDVKPWSSAKMLFVTFSIGGLILLVDYLIEEKISNSPLGLAILFFVIGISGAIQNRKQSN
jgi:DNA-binding CsgD family transcriptional regulator